MDKVVVTRQMLGIFGMQVCAEKGTPTKEILDVCNNQNPSGTKRGWCRVVRTEADLTDGIEKNSLPIQCEDHKDREHLIVIC